MITEQHCNYSNKKSKISLKTESVTAQYKTTETSSLTETTA